MYFGDGEPPTDFAGAKRTDEAAYAALLPRDAAPRAWRMAPGAYEAVFVGLAHADDVIDEIADRAHRAASAAATAA